MSDFLDRLKQDYLKSKTLTLAEVMALCPPCGKKMEASGMTHLDISAIADEVAAAVEEDKGKWSKWWKTATGDATHKFTMCVKKTKGHVKNPEAFCGKLKSLFGKKSKKK